MGIVILIGIIGAIVYFNVKKKKETKANEDFLAKEDINSENIEVKEENNKKKPIKKIIIGAVLAVVFLAMIIPSEEETENQENTEIETNMAKEDTIKTPSEKEKLYYEIIKVEDTSTGNVRKGGVHILVEDDIAKVTLENILKVVAEDEMQKRGYDRIWVYAYGDKRFIEIGNGYTHGITDYEKNGNYKQLLALQKESIPSEEKKEIYVDWKKQLSKSYEELDSIFSKLSTDEYDKRFGAIEETVTEEMRKKYDLTKEAFDEIIFEVLIYATS